VGEARSVAKGFAHAESCGGGSCLAGILAAILAFTWADCLAIPPRTAASAYLKDPQEGFMPQCQSGRSSKSSKEPRVRAMKASHAVGGRVDRGLAVMGLLTF